MKTIHTLIPDVYELIKRKDGWFNDVLADLFSKDVARRLQDSLSSEVKKRSLRISQIGPKCPCALWHSIHTPEEAEPLPPWAEIKYSFGHIIEALAITLARAAGHTVEGEQDAVEVDGIVGHRDCIIDGCLVDVKSAASFSFNKFKDGSIKENDPFGYLYQLDGYLAGSASDPLLKVKDSAYLWAVDKQLGHMCLYHHHYRPDTIRERVKEAKRVVSLSSAPKCECEIVADGKSGNMKLGTIASYNPYKYCCHPNLRTFLYADGPRYLTSVVRTPEVPEINKHGTIINQFIH